MLHKNWIFPILLLFLGAVSFFPRPVSADPAAQGAYQTPTARPDGHIVYIVQDGDSCLRIQLLTGTTTEELIALNQLDKNCTIRPNQELLLKVVTPAASPTPNPAVSATPLLPTPTPKKGSGKICINLFEDLNGNAFHEESETLLSGGAVSISDQQQHVSTTGTTTVDVTTPLCQEVSEGQYNVSIAIPSGYNATISTNRSVMVLAGDQATVEFGAQVSTIAPPPPPQQENNVLLAVVGGVLVLGGIGLGIYVAVARR